MAKPDKFELNESYELLGGVFSYLNQWADSMVFSKLLKDSYEFLSLLYNILLSVFTWMTIVAFKRLTKR